MRYHSHHPSSEILFPLPCNLSLPYIWFVSYFVLFCVGSFLLFYLLPLTEFYPLLKRYQHIQTKGSRLVLPPYGRPINTPSVSGRPKTWTQEALTIRLLGVLPYWVQGNDTKQTQTSGVGVGQHTQYLPWSLKGTWHGRSIGLITPIPPEVLAEIVGSTTSLRLTAGQQRQKDAYLMVAWIVADTPLDTVLIKPSFTEQLGPSRV